MINIDKIRIAASLSIATLVSSSVLAANVSSVSGENFKQIGKDAFWVAEVSCDDNSNATILRHADSDSWCPEGSDSLCNEDKTEAAKSSCSAAYKDQAVALAKVKADKADVARKAAQERAKRQAAAQQASFAAEQKIKEKISIQEELITIEEKRLNLTKQEMELDRRISEIQKILEAEDSEDEI